MPSESWGELVLPADPKDLIGAGLTVVRRPDGSIAAAVDPGFPRGPRPMKVTINGIQLGLPESIGTRTDEIGEGVTEITLGEAALNKLYAEHGKSQITQTQVEAIIGELQPMMEVAEAVKKTLADRGWTYEEAERVAGDFLRDAIAGGMRGQTK